MRNGIVMALFVAGFFGAVTAAEPIKSGLEVGEFIIPFEPYNVTGEYAGQEKCLVCMHGASPVACIFAREMSPKLTALIKKIDEATAKNSKADMGSFVCVLNDDKEVTEKTLKELAKKEVIKTTTLAICEAAGPKSYKLAKEADVTVMLYFEGEVKANFVFAKGTMTDKDIDRVLASIPKILPKK